MSEAAVEKVAMNVVVHKANVPLRPGESLDKFTSKLVDASRAHCYKKFSMNRQGGDYCWMVEAFSSSVIMSIDKQKLARKMFAMAYTRDAKSGEFTFGDAIEVERKTSFAPVSTTISLVSKAAKGLECAHPEMSCSACKARRTCKLEKAVWTAAFINGLPDSSFAVVSSGGKKDKEGKTVPRSLRHLPFKDTNGKVDLPHLRNALARLPQSNLNPADKAKARRVLEAAAKAAKVGAPAKKPTKKSTTGVEQLDISKGERLVFGDESSQWVQTSKSFWGGLNLF